MNAKFQIGKVTDESGEKHDADFIVLSGGFLGKDETVRPATAEDKEIYKAEYEAFKNPPAPPEDKDAKIAALKTELAKASEAK